MTILASLVLGLAASFIASMLMGSGGYGLIGDAIFGVLGALLGGWLSSQFLGLDVTGLNLTSLSISILGAAIVIFIYRAIAPGRRTV